MTFINFVNDLNRCDLAGNIRKLRKSEISFCLVLSIHEFGQMYDPSTNA